MRRANPRNGYDHTDSVRRIVPGLWAWLTLGMLVAATTAVPWYKIQQNVNCKIIHHFGWFYECVDDSFCPGGNDHDCNYDWRDDCSFFSGYTTSDCIGVRRLFNSSLSFMICAITAAFFGAIVTSCCFPKSSLWRILSLLLWILTFVFLCVATLAFVGLGSIMQNDIGRAPPSAPINGSLAGGTLGNCTWGACDSFTGYSTVGHTWWGPDAGWIVAMVAFFPLFVWLATLLHYWHDDEDYERREPTVGRSARVAGGNVPPVELRRA